MFHCILCDWETNQNSFMAPIIHCGMNSNELMFRGDLFVTIAEIYTLILDVCVSLHKRFFGIFFGGGDFIEKAKNIMF